MIRLMMMVTMVMMMMMVMMNTLMMMMVTMMMMIMPPPHPPQQEGYNEVLVLKQGVITNPKNEVDFLSHGKRDRQPSPPYSQATGLGFVCFVQS